MVVERHFALGSGHSVRRDCRVHIRKKMMVKQGKISNLATR